MLCGLLQVKVMAVIPLKGIISWSSCIIYITFLERSIAIGPLIINGFGEFQSGRYFVELYATDEIKDLSKYEIRTIKIKSLPKASITKGEFILLSSEGLRLAKHYSVAYSFSSTDFGLNHGKNGVIIIRSSDKAIIDHFATDSDEKDPRLQCTSPCSYNNGWVKPKISLEKRKDEFSMDEWSQHPGALATSCDDYSQRNCTLPFPVKYLSNGESYCKNIHNVRHRVKINYDNCYSTHK